jgi:hypothetical protein
MTPTIYSKPARERKGRRDIREKENGLAEALRNNAFSGMRDKGSPEEMEHRLGAQGQVRLPSGGKETLPALLEHRGRPHCPNDPHTMNEALKPIGKTTDDVTVRSSSWDHSPEPAGEAEEKATERDPHHQVDRKYRVRRGPLAWRDLTRQGRRDVVKDTRVR